MHTCAAHALAATCAKLIAQNHSASVAGSFGGHRYDRHGAACDEHHLRFNELDSERRAVSKKKMRRDLIDRAARLSFGLSLQLVLSLRHVDGEHFPVEAHDHAAVSEIREEINLPNPEDAQILVE